MTISPWPGLLALVLGTAAYAGQAGSPRATLARAMEDFQAGLVQRSLEGFDRVIALDRAAAPFLWQRGIALYYAGRFRDCQAQFESHRTVNPDDVENAAWHFLCVARAETLDAAIAKLLPVGPDARPPMREIYQMFQGKLTDAQVLAAAGRNPSAQFYAHLYVGLYREARRDRSGAREQIALAADPRFAEYGGYMHDVARVHLKALG